MDRLNRWTTRQTEWVYSMDGQKDGRWYQQTYWTDSYIGQLYGQTAWLDELNEWTEWTHKGTNEMNRQMDGRTEWMDE